MGARASEWMFLTQVSTSSRVRTMKGRFFTPVPPASAYLSAIFVNHWRSPAAVTSCLIARQRAAGQPAPRCSKGGQAGCARRCGPTWLLQDGRQRLQCVLQDVLRADVHLQRFGPPE